MVGVGLVLRPDDRRLLSLQLCCLAKVVLVYVVSGVADIEHVISFLAVFVQHRGGAFDEVGSVQEDLLLGGRWIDGGVLLVPLAATFLINSAISPVPARLAHPARVREDH